MHQVYVKIQGRQIYELVFFHSLYLSWALFALTSIFFCRVESNHRLWIFQQSFIFFFKELLLRRGKNGPFLPPPGMIFPKGVELIKADRTVIPQ